jgi:hypothetical protein
MQQPKVRASQAQHDEGLGSNHMTVSVTVRARSSVRPEEANARRSSFRPICFVTCIFLSACAGSQIRSVIFAGSQRPNNRNNVSALPRKWYYLCRKSVDALEVRFPHFRPSVCIYFFLQGDSPVSPISRPPRPACISRGGRKNKTRNRRTSAPARKKKYVRTFSPFFLCAFLGVSREGEFETTRKPIDMIDRDFFSGIFFR